MGAQGGSVVAHWPNLVNAAKPGERTQICGRGIYQSLRRSFVADHPIGNHLRSLCLAIIQYLICPVMILSLAHPD